MELYYVDAFTDKPFYGNPAAVCVLDKEIDDTVKQNIAFEINFSETAFLYPYENGYRLRWFTPKMEVDLCGHATLASAHILWNNFNVNRGSEILFYTNSGVLKTAMVDDMIVIDFPSTPAEDSDVPAGLIEGLGIDPLYVGKSIFDYLIEVASDDICISMEPDFLSLQKFPVRGFIVTAQSKNKEYDFISRFFAPSAGINEDPVTGSAHCCLGPYWQKKLGKKRLKAFQASQRTGTLIVENKGDRVLIYGNCVTVMKAEVLI